MSERALRRLLWLALFVALPVPLLGIGIGRVPALHQLELGLLALVFTLVEHARGFGPLLSALFLGQALVYAVALALVARLAARLLSRLPPLVRTRAALLMVTLGLALAIAQPIYRTPYSAHSARASLLGVYR